MPVKRKARPTHTTRRRAPVDDVAAQRKLLQRRLREQRRVVALTRQLERAITTANTAVQEFVRSYVSVRGFRLVDEHANDERTG